MRKSASPGIYCGQNQRVVHERKSRENCLHQSGIPRFRRSGTSWRILRLTWTAGDTTKPPSDTCVRRFVKWCAELLPSGFGLPAVSQLVSVQGLNAAPSRIPTRLLRSPTLCPKPFVVRRVVEIYWSQQIIRGCIRTSSGAS